MNTLGSILFHNAQDGELDQLSGSLDIIFHPEIQLHEQSLVCIWCRDAYIGLILILAKELLTITSIALDPLVALC